MCVCYVYIYIYIYIIYIYIVHLQEVKRLKAHGRSTNK